MTGIEKDPFERLSQIAPPEPDPANVDAVAAMSARAFSAELARASEGRKKAGRFAKWFSGTNWLLPATATAGALVVAVLVVPVFIGQDGAGPAPSDATLSREPAAVAEAEPLPSPPGQALSDQGEGVRMGAVPTPQQQGLPLDLSEDATVETYIFGDIEIVERSTAEEFALYLVDGGIERQFDRRVKEPSENIVLTDAFHFEGDGSGSPVLLIRSGTEDGQQQWDAFVDSGNGYALSGALSMQVYDADDRAEVIARLEDGSGQ